MIIRFFISFENSIGPCSGGVWKHAILFYSINIITRLKNNSIHMKTKM
jgi:hypothetical protein